MDSNGLGATRSLGRLGIEVNGLDYKNDVGFYSKYCQKKIIIENPINNPEKCLEQLIELGKNSNERAVLLPTADYFVTILSKNKEELSKYFTFNVPEKGVLVNIIDKRKQYKTADNLGIQIAKTYYSDEETDLLDFSLSFPVFIKGLNASKWAGIFNKKGFIANNILDLRNIINMAKKNSADYIIQELIQGPNINHFKVCAYYNKNTELLALFSTQKARQCPSDFGVGSYMVSGFYEDIIRLAKHFFEGINYTGIGSIEFKKDDRDGKFKMIELNPRIWMQNIQATYAGVNFPYLYYLDCCGEKVPQTLSFKNNIRWLDAIQDFQSYLGNRKKGDIDFWSWFLSILKADCYAYFAWDDLKPGFINSNYWIKYLKLPLKIFNKN